MRRASKIFVLSIALFGLLAGCAAQQRVRQGDALLKQGQPHQAIEQYEEALRLDADHSGAKTGIRDAQRALVEKEIDKGEEALREGQNASALNVAMGARRMPLDLDAVDLVRRIDLVISTAIGRAEERVAKLAEEGHFLPALKIAEKVLEAAPGVPRRKAWVAELRSKAAEHHGEASRQYVATGLHGAAAVQLAFAIRAGADVKPEKVEALWERFAEPTCFAEPEVELHDASRKAGQLLPRLELTARSELTKLRERCGEGTQPLRVSISLQEVTIVDDETKEIAAKPLPGERIQTEETYLEEETYTVLEDVTEYETRKELVERRDCAPRPGKERGCVTWTEEVENQVPVTRKKEVQKTRQVEKTRPIKGPLPADKVLSYELTTVNRAILAKGVVQVRRHAKDKPLEREFTIRLQSKDSSHPEVRGGQGAKAMVIDADPLEVKPMHEVLAEAAQNISEEVRRAVHTAVDGWTKSYREDAAAHVLQGQMPQAEELYLKMMALGAEDDADVSRFFQRRYGEPVARVMLALAQGMGRMSAEEAQATESASTERAGQLPKRRAAGVAREAPKLTPAKEPPPHHEQRQETVPLKAAEQVVDDELDELEAASFEATKPQATPAPVSPAREADGEVGGSEPQSGSSTDEPPAANSDRRGPVMPSPEAPK